jgi:hypothetical protein
MAGGSRRAGPHRLWSWPTNRSAAEVVDVEVGDAIGLFSRRAASTASSDEFVDEPAVQAT